MRVYNNARKREEDVLFFTQAKLFNVLPSSFHFYFVLLRAF